MNKTPILNDSNEGYFIVEFKLHLQYFRKSSFNAGSCFNFLTVLADLWKGDIEYYYFCPQFLLNTGML